MITEQDDDFLSQMFADSDTTKETIPDSGINEDEDDEIEVPETTTQIDPPSVETTISADEERVQAYVSFLEENDLIRIPEGMEFNGNAEQLQEIFNHTKQATFEEAIDTIFEKLPADFQPLFNYALAGGNSIKDFLDVHAAKEYESMDLRSESNQKEVLRSYYRATTKHTPEKIDRLISLISDPDDLQIAAEEAREDLIILREEEKGTLIQRAAQEAEAAKQRVQQQTVALASSIDASNLIHPQRKNKVKAFFFEPIQVDNQTTTGFNNTIQAILKNPEHQAQLGDILIEYDQQVGFSMDRLEKKVKSKATQNFKKLLDQTLDAKQNQSKSSSAAPTSGKFDWSTYQQY